MSSTQLLVLGVVRMSQPVHGYDVRRTLLGLAMSAASYGLALKLKSEDAFAPVQNSIIVPLLLLSGILLPMSLAPTWLFTVSRFNPFVYVVDATRAVGDLTGTTVLLGSSPRWPC